MKDDEGTSGVAQPVGWLRLARMVTVLSVAGWALAAAALLYACYCTFASLQLRVNDYAIYTNFLWNSAHGRPFVCLTDRSYLGTHLSFSLLLLAPLFRVWDDPFLLMGVQWFCALAGSLLVWRTAARLRFPSPLPVAFGMFYFCYPHTQSAMLYDFHGVCIYMFLVPWLYHALAVQGRGAWLPWLLILGLREDAFTIVLPMLLYFAIREKRRDARLLAILSVAYAWLAMFVMFPAASVKSLAERRHREISAVKILRSFDGEGLLARAGALFWLLLPSAAAAGRQWLPVLVFPSLSLLVTQLSWWPRMHRLGVHYGAFVFPLMAVGLMEALRRRGAAEFRRSAAVGLAAFMVAVTVAAHFAVGRFPRANSQTGRFLQLKADPDGRSAIWAARHLPREGLLVTSARLAPVCANRADFRHDLDVLGKRMSETDVIFLDFQDREAKPWLSQLLDSPDFGVTYFDYRYAIFQRGAATTGNAEVRLVDANRERTVDCSSAPRTRGRNSYAPGCDTARYWDGDGTETNALLCHKAAVRLAPGRYLAMFRLRAEAPRHDVRKSWGLLSVFREDSGTPLATAEIDAVAGIPGEFRCQSMSFALTEPASVEPRVQGADAPLWLDRVIFIPEDGAGGF